MNGKAAKRLRRAARALALPEQTSYAPMGVLRHQYAADGVTVVPMRRPFAMKACERKAIKEAKRLYTGKALGGEEYLEPTSLREEREFKHLVVDSIKKQPSAPSLGGGAS